MKSSRRHSSLPPDATESIVESISDGVFTVDHDWHITSFNRAAEQITGVRREEAVGRLCSEVFRANMCETDCALHRTMKTGKPVINRTAYIVDAEGHNIPISVSTALLKDRKGKVVGGVETFRDLSLYEELRKELEGRFQVEDMISRSASMRTIFEILPRLASSESIVLIQGETGTGKELLARAIHNTGPRKNKPFVAVNCAALPDTLLESELFGYKAGAFTGAQRDKPGRFDAARGGTIFLDEIGDISPALQVRLLRVLQERTYEPLGSTRPVKSDARVIVATNRDLAALVKKGEFRQDLFYRINVVPVELPPLRKRREDIPALADHFIARLNRRQNRSVTGVSREVLALLMAHDFPGNVRELENIIEHAFVLCPEGGIETEHLPAELVSHPVSPRAKASLSSTVRTVEAQAIRAALQRNRGNRLAAARELGMHKSTLFRKVRELGLVLPEEDGRSLRKRSR